jgi:chromosome partitioning protein
MLTITLLNQKGGVGKTSSCFHLAGALAKSGRRVLLIDNDPQASLTQGFFGPDATRSIASEATVAALFDPSFDPTPEALILPSGFKGIWIVPGSIDLTDANMRPRVEWPHAEHGIRSFVDAVGHDFDLALIDCPPNLHLCSWGALVASDRIVVPLQAEDFGSQGLAPVQASILAVQSGPNPTLGLTGYLLTMYDKRLSVHVAYEEMLRDQYGPAVFAVVIPRAKDFVEAVAMRRPLAFHKPRSASARAVEAVTAELLARVSLGSEIAEERGAA